MGLISLLACTFQQRDSGLLLPVLMFVVPTSLIASKLVID